MLGEVVELDVPDEDGLEVGLLDLLCKTVLLLKLLPDIEELAVPLLEDTRLLVIVGDEEAVFENAAEYDIVADEVPVLLFEIDDVDVRVRSGVIVKAGLEDDVLDGNTVIVRPGELEDDFETVALFVEVCVLIPDFVLSALSEVILEF